MVTMSHEITYQGYPCTKVQFTRSVGLSPDKGSVEINMKDLNEIKIKPYPVRFRSAYTEAVPNGIPISVFVKKGKDKVSGSGRDPLKGLDSGLNEFGSLTMNTQTGGGVLSGNVVEYRDIYVDSSGLEEVTEDLDEILDHDQGIIRVPLTDIRQFYAGRSPLYQRINYHVASGKYDPESIYFENAEDAVTEKGREKGKPFTSSQIFSFLFSQLPGSPPCHTDKGVNLSTLPEPQDIVGGGQPVVEVIQRLLDQNGLEACFQPDGSYVLATKAVAEDIKNKVPTEIGKLTYIPYIHYEKKTHSISSYPALVEVIGKKKVRQFRAPYVAVVQDTDGVWRDIKAIEELWEYWPTDKNGTKHPWTNGAIATQALLSSDKSFDDVPPGDRAIGDKALLYHRRREILRTQAYKVFAPAWLIRSEQIKPSYGGQKLYGFREGDVDVYPTLPMMECPIAEHQFDELYKQIPRPKGSSWWGGVGSQRNVVWVPPIVSGSHHTSGLFENFSAVARHYSSLERASYLKLEEAKAALKQLQDSFMSYRKQEENVLSALKQNKLYGSNLLTGLVKDIREATGIGPSELSDFDDTAQESMSYLARVIETVSESIKTHQTSIKNMKSTLKTHKENFKAFKTVYGKFGSVWLKYNIPHQVLSGGYSIDRKTGIIKFSKPMFIAKKPYYFDSETEEISKEADVEVMYGYESNTNTKYDFTTVQVGSTTVGQKRVEALAMQVGGGMSPYIIRAPSLRLAQEETGALMNVESIKTAAENMASGILKQPSDATGYDRQYIGLWGIILDRGVSQITHEFDGDVAYTHVAFNAPSAFHPGGFARLKPSAGQSGNEAVSILSTSRGLADY